MADEGEKISFDKAMEIEQAGVYEVYLTVEVKDTMSLKPVKTLPEW